MLPHGCPAHSPVFGSPNRKLTKRIGSGMCWRTFPSSPPTRSLYRSSVSNRRKPSVSLNDVTEWHCLHWKTQCWRCFQSGESYPRQVPGSPPALPRTRRCLDLRHETTNSEEDDSLCISVLAIRIVRPLFNPTQREDERNHGFTTTRPCYRHHPLLPSLCTFVTEPYPVVAIHTGSERT